MPINNNLQKITTYQQDYTLPTLEALLTWTSLTDKKFQNWSDIVAQRDDTVKYRLPTLFNVTDSLSFDPDSTGSFTERFGYLSVDQARLVNYAMTDEQLATYPLEELANDMGDEAMISLAGNIDAYVAQKAVTGGYRWVGNWQAANNSMSTFQDLRKAVTIARNFGGDDMLHAVLPDTASTLIANSGFQEFAPSRNDSLVKSWELGSVNGIANCNFYQSQLNPVHTSGTASNKEITITNVTQGTYTENGLTFSSSTISLSGLTSGETIVADDVGDITGATPIKYLRQQDHTTTAINPQFKVISGGTASAGGTLDIVVSPALIFDGTNANPERNLSRAIVTATDKVRIVPSHKTGAIFFKPALQMAVPKLPSKSPFESAVAQSKSGISMRTYHGSMMGKDVHQMVHDILFGVTMARDYGVRMIFPLDSDNLSF